MSRLTPIEQECQDVLSIVSDYMAPGHMLLSAKAHMTIAGKVRDALTHLLNKEFGCDTGKHAGACACQKMRKVA